MSGNIQSAMCLLKGIFTLLKDYVKAIFVVVAKRTYISFPVPSAACLLLSIIPDSGTIRLLGQDFLAQV